MINYIKKWLNLNFYISELDQFLKQYRASHSKLSSSQKAEIEKYKIIHRKRDHADKLTHQQSGIDELFWE
jgi:flagellar biosynthesis chaperone FliJ